MKIVAIRGKNLASLEGEFMIDFTVEPLCSAGIFAITGSTGAGKSTLLDALCLALFDCTPRMNKAKENNVSVMDVADRGIAQNDSRSILRRGTAEGYSEVDFVALTGEVFRSRWTVRRSRGKVSGSLQKVEMTLTNLTSGVEQLEKPANSFTAIGTDGAIRISVSAPTLVSVYNLSGQKVAEQLVAEETLIALPAGFYIVNGTKVIVR